MEDKVKIIAFHLPQYHQIPENDAWWGEGFTEWTNVKKAIPLFAGHQQPKKPLDGFYYDMTDHAARVWQANLAQKYGIYGFCYYHYWFDGKLLLEKPLEALLREKDIGLPFCLCWANEPWARTWDGKGNQILIEQRYGKEAEWLDHFSYLEPFLRDSRYIRINNKPVIVIYRSSSIKCYDEMMQCWREEGRKRGIGELYIIDENNSFQNHYETAGSDAVLYLEPMYTIQYGRSVWEKVIQRIKSRTKGLRYQNNIHYYNYDELWRNILRRKENGSKTAYPGAFVGWDNTPRKGKRGVVIEGATPEKFQQYMQRQMEHAKQAGSEYLFLNAWNEWAEGTYLEPDEDHSYQYLEAIAKLMQETSQER